MVFNGSTNAFSNTVYAFPYAAYSMFAVYSNTTAPASTAYMNAVYGSNGYPMLGVYDVNKYVSARSVAANTGALVANVAASSNVLVSATYTPSTFSPFINGTAATTLAGTTLITTGLYLGGPSNYFNGSISELLVFGTTLTHTQRQSVEGYLAKKWGIGTALLNTHPFYTTPPFNRYFSPTDLAGCSLWLDGADNSSMNSATTVTTWNDKSGQSNTMTGTATWSGSNMTFNGSTQAFSNTTYVFPASNYSMFAVYSNTTAPASTAYMNAVYGSNGYPMLGVYDVNKYVSARSVVANTGALSVQVGWAAQITGAVSSTDTGRGIATDTSGNVFVIGSYTQATFTLYNTNGTAGATLPLAGGQDCYIAKYTSAGVVSWAAQIAGTGNEIGYGIATDTSGNVFAIGHYGAALTLYNSSGVSNAALPNAGNQDVFVAKYTSAGAVAWAAQITSTGTDFGYAIATDTSGNVFVTGSYAAALTLCNTGGGTGATLPFTGGTDCYIAKYTSAGAVSWAAQIGATGNAFGYGIATDTSGNVFVTGQYGSTLTLYNTGGGTGATLPLTGATADAFIAKYTSAGAVAWAAQITSAAADFGQAIATDTSGNVFVTGYYGAAVTLCNTGGTTGATLSFVGGNDAFIAKYSPNGYIIGPVPASSNVLVSATYTPSTFSPFINGSTATTLAGTTLATTGLFVGGPSNYFNGSISELLIYASTLSPAQRQQVEGYLIQKWGLSTQTVAGHQYKLIPPAVSQPAQFSEVTPGNWTRDWNPYLQSLVAANGSATPTYSVLTGTTTGYKMGFLAPNGNIYLPPQAVNQGAALITPTPTGATFSTTAITGVSTGQIYGNDWIGGAMYPDGILYLVPYDASYNNTPGIADLNTNTNVFRSNPYTTGNTTNLNLQLRSGTMAPDGNMYILPYAINTGSAVNIYYFNPITKLLVAYPVNKPTAERFSFAILAPNGNIYGVSIIGPAQVCMINPAAKTFTTIGSNATLQYTGLVYGGNGNIYMIPTSNATGIGILNTTTNTITANAITGGLGYYGGVLGPDGNIYCIPSTATNIGVINTRTNTFSTLGSVTANSYGSAVLAPNGNIYLIPTGASGIGMISFTGLNLLPSTSFCLSPFVNRGALSA
jgi:hypothetical protein